ncbi:MAG: hypothetical protein IJO80_04355, partial [Firmicutes bacterium]|nr:hypothetical protein [Bacillota bacterium]
MVAIFVGGRAVIGEVGEDAVDLAAVVAVIGIIDALLISRKRQGCRANKNTPAGCRGAVVACLLGEGAVEEGDDLGAGAGGI